MAKIIERIETCLACDRYIRCNDPKKAIRYSCSRYVPTSLGASTFQLFDPLTYTASSPKEILELTDTDSAESEFKLIQTILDVVKSKDNILSRDLRVPDGDFPTAPNFYTFCTDPYYLKQKPYAWQVIVPTIYLGEFCPRCSDVDYIYENWTSTDSYARIEKKIAFLEHGKCPHCKGRRSRFFRREELYVYEEAAICLGQRSGKSVNTADVAAYLTHQTIKLQNVNEVYGLKSNSELHGTFCALTYGQAKDTLWEPYYSNIIESPWFTNYHEMLDEVGRKYGEELYRVKDSFVHYRHRKIKFYPAGPDKRILRGRTRFFASVDELGWFPNGPDAKKLVKMNADEVYKALSNSLWTVRSAANLLLEKGFDNIPTAYFVNLSSPSSVRDKIMELVRKAQDSTKIFGIQLPTWEANPSMPRKMFDEEFKRDPIGAMRDFGAQPPISNSPLISNHDLLQKCASKYENPIQIAYETTQSKGGSKTRYARATKVRPLGKPAILAIDAGYSNNSFACAVGHLVDNKHPKIDLLVEVQPLPGVPLNYTKIYEMLLKPIIQARNVVIITADRWNSIKVLQDAQEEFDIEAMQYSLKYPDMVMFKDYIESNQFKYPAPVWSFEDILNYNQADYPAVFKRNPVEHFILQCLTVQDTGTTVTKGDQLTDDLVRASMLCLYQLMDEDNIAMLLSSPEVKQRINVMTSLVMKTYSSASGSTKTEAMRSSSGGVIGMAKQRKEQ